jgi:hypothetical protein
LLSENSTTILDLVADVDAAAAGSTITATFDQTTIDVVDGMNTDLKQPLLPQTPYPALTATVK